MNQQKELKSNGCSRLRSWAILLSVLALVGVFAFIDGPWFQKQVPIVDEIFTLIEAWRKANQVAQVDFTWGAFDHKHQEVSPDDPKAGLHKMSVDIVTTLFKALIIEEGLEVSDHFFRDLAVTYTSIAEDLIKKYSDNARFNGLEYDRDAEEATVRNVFAKAVLFAGFILESPQHIAENIIRFVSSHQEFNPFLEDGFIQTVLNVEERLRLEIFTEAELPSWERVQEKDPEIIRAIIDVIEKEKTKYGPLPAGRNHRSRD